MALFRRGSQPAPPPFVGEADQEDHPAVLRRHADSALNQINRLSGDVPTFSVVQSLHLVDVLTEVIDLSQVRPLDIHAAITVRRTLCEYLPDTLNAYVQVPVGSRNTPRASGKTPTGALRESLSAMQLSAAETLAAAQAQDVDALMTQGAFLTTKFSRSDLDL